MLENLPPKILARFKALSIVALVIVFCILLTFLVGTYFENAIETHWDNISAEKNIMIKDDCIRIFDNYQKETSQFSSDLLKNKKFKSALVSQNTKKGYDVLFDVDNINDYNVEAYNSRLEQFLFLGRQLNPDILELQRAMKGEKFSSVKEIGFYTYVVVFEPFGSDSAFAGESDYGGILVTAKLLDIKYKIKNKYFRNLGITSEIYDRYHTNVELSFKPYPGVPAAVDSSFLKENESYELKNINREIIGALYVPRSDKASYIRNIRNKFINLLDIELFILNLLVIAASIVFVRNLKSGLIKGLIIGTVLILSRYFWLLLEFPSRLFVDTDIEVFSPAYYAYGVAFGIAKSIGELFITSVIILLLCYYIVTLVISAYKTAVKTRRISLDTAIIFLCIFILLIAVHIYGVIIQGLVNDSNLKYFDRTQIISTDQLELLTAQFSILLLSVSLIMLMLACSLIIVRHVNLYLSSNKTLRKNSIIAVFAFIILISLFVEALPFLEYSLKFDLRLLIIVLAGLFSYNVFRQLNLKRDFNFNTVLNISLLVLVCVIFVPVVMLNKITSQENKYLELLAKSISDRADDKINILISTSLEDIADNPNLEFDIKNKNKFPKLAFNIWSETKLDQEDLNTAVFVLDTAKRLVSDFNINPSELTSDSVVNFAERNIKKSGRETLNTSDLSENEESDEAAETGSFDAVLQNRENKFYCGIKPIEKIDLRGSRFNRVLGYVVIAAQYDAKNFLSQSSMQIFKSFTRDNLINKLTYPPVISEFTDGELVGSSNKDVSKSFIKSLDLFRESVRDKIDKSALRYDEVEGQLYKSYYVLLTQRGVRNNTDHEKIYVVSMKLNDFGLVIFFVFKYLLFVVAVYLIFVSVYFAYIITVYFSSIKKERLFRFGFREKLFASFFVVSVIPIIILAVYSREYAQSKNNEFYRSQMISDLRLVEQYIKNKLTPRDYLSLSQAAGSEKQSSFANIFGRGFSESHKNFNLYIKTKLEATTDEQLYKSDLLDTRISGKAFYNIALLKKDFFTETIDIGSLSVIVGYKPMYDNLNNLTGIISSQTVFKQNEINQELTESLVYIFGAYFVAVIFLLIIVNLLSYRISNPIIKLQKATEQLSKGNTSIQVRTSSKDEIGELVRSFNKMTRELQRSRDELKKVERESAWREIARQVAHEIKNPLTPMKLAMQHLYYAYSRGSNDFKSILQTTNKLITDQVETLNRIATEFSDFAKMPSRNYQPLKIDEIIQDVVNLMNTEGKILLKISSPSRNRLVYGDKDEVKRALINIIRNSMQAIDEKVCERKDGSISIEGRQNNGYYSVYVKDNGIGMDEPTLQKLFEPYFSTKSAGMGLGLVITKKIIDDMKAKIYVRSELDKGTEIEIRFNLMDRK
jgi:nitrogen fixation/metabolism regulation signal transduction histidine kinase